MRRAEYGEDNLYVVEVYYDGDEDTVIGWTEKDYVWGIDIDEIRMVLNWMLDCLEKPILDEAELLRQAEEMRDTDDG